MKYLKLGNLKNPISVIGIGCMRIAGMNRDELDYYVHTALDSGINFFDHADIYASGKSEEIFGDLLCREPSLRDKVFIQSKCAIHDSMYDFSKDYIIKSVDGILKRLYTTLPQKIKNEPYIPSDSDIRQVLEYAKGSQFEIPIILACYGLRRSEICALTVDDIEGDVIKVGRARVLGDRADWTDKITKTAASTREVIIPPEIAGQIREQGYVYRGHPNSITLYLSKAEDRLGLPHFSLHKLRHYFASKMSSMNVPEADIMRMGGWETDHVMKRVYRHSMMEKELDAKRAAAEKLKIALFS